jgi:CRISPR-associated protein Cmr2
MDSSRTEQLQYAAVTFSPVQGFIEKTRKLRDLYGASIILSYLSQQIVQQADLKGYQVISPGLPNLSRGMPNRILLQHNTAVFDTEELGEWVQQTLLTAWRKICDQCRDWIVEHLPQFTYHWDRDWELWRSHTWEIFWGAGDSISSAMNDLEHQKLSRNWTGINWIGESSSLTGADAIAWPGLGDPNRNPKKINWTEEDRKIKEFYRCLAFVLDGESPNQPKEKEPEGKYIDQNEKLSIPELIKRLVTLPEVADKIQPPKNQHKIQRAGSEKEDDDDDEDLLPKELRSQGFTDLKRRPQDNPNGENGQWTGWFMGDGDQVGPFLKGLTTDSKVATFSHEMREWGKRFIKEFNHKNIGRVVYAGGDDFFGLIYNQDFPKKSKDSIALEQVLEWLKTLDHDWKKGKPDWIKKVNLSVGFVWAAPGVPQRDVLQHCREAEKRSKSEGRDRLTIRILFNNGQYVQWTTPWKYLGILDNYKDRNGGKNWNHIYSDLEQLKSRHALGLAYKNTEFNPDPQEITDDRKAVREFLNCYFYSYREDLKAVEKELFKDPNKKDYESAQAMISWIDDLITVGWYLLKNSEN